MNEIKLDWDDLRLFLSVAKAGGLGPAAMLSGKSAPTLGRRMVELERSLGVELFRRKPRGYELTKAGEDLLSKVGSIDTQVQSLVPNKAPPLVKISAGTWVTRVLINKLDQLQNLAQVRLRFIAAEEVLNIGRREAVIGIRNNRPEGITLAGRKVGRVRFAIYARNVEVLTWAQVVANTPSANWIRKNSEGEDTIEVTSPQNALDLALKGWARAVLPTFVGDQEATLMRISEVIDELDHDQWLVTHHEDRHLPEVRHVIDRTYSVLKSICASE